MDIKKIAIAGDIYQDQGTLERYSHDASSYKIIPQLVVAPKSEDDIVKVVTFARNEGLSITSRSGGTGLSGAAIGNGIILDFQKYFHRVLDINDRTVVQPGTILVDFQREIESCDLMLPPVPMSSSSCALGGNVGTRSTGPYTTRYGSIDEFIVSLRFITSSGEVIDTEETLPAYISDGINRIRDQFLDDSASLEFLQDRPMIAGGYNLKAMSKYADPAQILTHLMVGSVGTLGIITEIRLRLISHRPSRGTLVALFNDVDEFFDAGLELKKYNPAALEFADASCLRQINGKILNTLGSNASVALIIEFDSSRVQVDRAIELLKRYDLTKLWEIHPGDKNEALLLDERKRILPSLRINAQSNQMFVPSIIDNIAIHLKDFGTVYREIDTLMRHLDQPVSFFGHLGFGSIQAYPYFNVSDRDLRQKMVIVSSGTYEILKKFHGTLVGVYNTGRSNAVYLKQELGGSFKYMEMIKKLLDPDDLLNPGIVFNPSPIYADMDLSRYASLRGT